MRQPLPDTSHKKHDKKLLWQYATTNCYNKSEQSKLHFNQNVEVADTYMELFPMLLIDLDLQTSYMIIDIVQRDVIHLDICNIYVGLLPHRKNVVEHDILFTKP